jgi:hypothetical protein
VLQPLANQVVVQAGRKAHVTPGGTVLPEKAKGTWLPQRGSYEEAVLSWDEQVEAAFRRRIPGGPTRRDRPGAASVGRAIRRATA